MALRILVSLILLISILYFPFWLSAIIAFGAMIYFSLFLEGVFLFLLSDLLYGAKEERYFGMIFVSFFLSIILLAAVEITKRAVRFYPKE